MKNRTIQWVTIILCARLALGCATIIHGTEQDIHISSAPDEAKVWIDGEQVGVTPAKLTLKRKHNHTILVKKEGYKDAVVSIESETSAWIVGNIIFGGIIGCGIDLITGGAYDLKPERVDLNLTEVASLDGKTIHVEQAQLDQLKEVRFLDGTGRPEIVVKITWVD